MAVARTLGARSYGRAMRDGTLLPSPGAHHGKQGFGEWLNCTPGSEEDGEPL